MARPRRTSFVPPPPDSRRVRLHPHGIVLGPSPRHRTREGEVVPLYAGSMHYWRHSPDEWAPGLDAMRSLGFRILDTYVPWAVHEVSEGVFDFGERFAHLDVPRFLRMAEERGLYVIIRPGPHINAELSFFGLPERIVWKKECQARSPRGNPVVLPMVPVAFPVPSYASDAFHSEAERWFAAFSQALASLRYPDGPIVLVQVDNEGALYFRDGPYDQDYHPDALRLYRSFLKDKYRSLRELREIYGQPQATFSTVEPPTRFDATTADELSRHLDWMEFHEHLLTTAMERFASTLASVGFDGLPTTHNFPLGEAATPLNAGRMSDVIDLLGLDYYHHASPRDHMVILRRTTELATRAEGSRLPAFGAEVGAGFPPFFDPLDEKDSLYTLLAALAYGLRGYNLYMAVCRDRWVGGPIDPRGRRRALADEYEKLNRALERVRFHTLRRRAPVRLVVPRVLRRLARATHAFGPATPALFNVLGAGYRESCLEDPLGLDDVVTLAGEDYLRAFERSLTARGVPFAYAGGECLEVSTEGARWVICVTVGGVKPELFARLRAVQRRGAKVTVGPRVPDRDGSMRRLGEEHDARSLEVEPLVDIADADALVAKRIEELSLPAFPATPDEVFVCLHEDEAGVPRVAFVMNPRDHAVEARISVPGASQLDDLLSEGVIPRRAGSFELTVPARTIRLFSVEASGPSSFRMRAAPPAGPPISD